MLELLAVKGERIKYFYIVTSLVLFFSKYSYSFAACMFGVAKPFT